jgi:fructose-1,6-bisphosphatase II / sedoheptulose-1,7-bisphosphatase
VTEAAAVAASKLIGRGDEKAADHAAVEAMREALNQLDFDGTVVIGEGERDEAPMLYIGERVGARRDDPSAPRIDIALDPLEGTTITAKAGPNALAVLAIAERGCLLNAPRRLYGQARGRPGLSRRRDRPRQVPVRQCPSRRRRQGRRSGRDHRLRSRSAAPRRLIAELRGLGCGIMLIPDGDVAGVIAVTDPDTTIDIYMGSGGAPEGVLAAAALSLRRRPVQGPPAVPKRGRARPCRQMGSRGP